jgi:GT2 family glycosyltransferase
LFGFIEGLTMVEISVVITTLNPNAERLRRTLHGLAEQILPCDRWEIILVDNASEPPMRPSAYEQHSNLILLREDRLGSTFGRLKAVEECNGEFVVVVDDDCVLNSDYLAQTAAIFARLPKLGVGGGRRLPEWVDRDPEPWVEEFYPLLALDAAPGVGEMVAAASSLPDHTPIGAGMIARKKALEPWVRYCRSASTPVAGRVGKELISAEDHDMVLHAARAGWHIGFFPDLVLRHLIPAGRLSREYLARLNRDTNLSFIQMLVRHGETPQPPAARWTVPLRKARSYFRHRAWKGPAEFVRWKGHCGTFEARAWIRERQRP